MKALRVPRAATFGHIGDHTALAKRVNLLWRRWRLAVLVFAVIEGVHVMLHVL